MGTKRSKIYWLLIIVLYLPNTRGACDWINSPKINDVCTALLQCKQVIIFYKNEWDCIKHVEYTNNYGYYYSRGNREPITTYDNNFNLLVDLIEVDEETSIFYNNEFTPYIKKLHILNGNWLNIPNEINKLSDVFELEISNNEIAEVNLNKFISLTKLKNIILRNNSISSLSTNTLPVVGSRTIESIDLTRNVLESIPDSCFSLFPELKYLNLSHNHIKSFDILTFEGVMGLITLDVSHNKLFEIGNSFTRFINLEQLYLQNNELSNLADYNLNKLTKLQKLNISFNKIDKVENGTFKNLLMLEYLDLRNNRIATITKNLFEYNENLQSLFLANNIITAIADDAFEDKNITEFNIKGNSLAGVIKKEHLKGIHVNQLDLSNESITSLDNETFKYMCQDLNFLNISYNNLSYISNTAFDCLEQLTVLDLAHNILNGLNFSTSSLKNLTSLHAQNNKIGKIPNLSNLISLTYIDLAYNEIREIELHAFLGLQNVETLSIKNNPFVNTLRNNSFDGMTALQSIELSNTRCTSYENRSFSGLSSLERINSSFGQLNNLAYNAFIDTGSIKTLNFSNNMLTSFHINTSSIQKVEEINLNYNLIRFISSDTFSGLKELRRLSLTNNNIQKIEPYAFKDSLKIVYIFLSSNKKMVIIGNPFDNLTDLYQLNMDGVTTNFTFQNNTSIANLNLQSCGIKDLNRISIFNVNDLSELNLSNNKIERIDKFSLQSLPYLVKLDLSSNLIYFIQPGSFLHVSQLRVLTLFGNNLQTLKFGVFDGPRELNYVNLSNNALQNFNAKLLPVAISLGLDNNAISNLDFIQYFESSIMRLSVGGNQFSCKDLAELKNSKYSEKFNNVLTSAKPDFHSENVNGITCQSVTEHGKEILPVGNFTTYDVRPVFIKFTNAIENLQSLIKSLENNSTDKSQNDKSEITEVIKSIEDLVAISNRTQIKSDSYLKHFESMVNATTTHLEIMKDLLTNLTAKNKPLVPDYNYTNNRYNDNTDGIRLEMKQMVKDEIEAIRQEFGKTFQNIQKPIPESVVAFKETGDNKVLYFIATIVSIIVVLYIINIVYRCYKEERKLNSNHSTSSRPFASGIELE